MNNNKSIYMICAGGHARVIIDIMQQAGQLISGILDNNISLSGSNIFGVSVLGTEDYILSLNPHEVLLVNGLGNNPKGKVTDLNARFLLFEKFKSKGFSFNQVKSKDSFISKYAIIKEGSQVITGSIIHPGSVIGVNTIINTGASIDHDCRVGDHTHIAPQTVLCGNVSVGNSCHIGAGSIILPGICIGDNVLVGAGSVIVKDVDSGSTIMGNPARCV